MGKDKLKKWAENKTFPHVFEPSLLPIIKGAEEFELKGKWHTFFQNDHPIVIELGCGKGEYTVDLARRYPHKNFIGIDVKGHRFHKGAKEAFSEGLKNVAFIRMRIEFIDAFFAADEISEIWITFCDPQPLDHEGKRRITSPFYLDKYRKFTKHGALLQLKHDNDRVYEKALREWTDYGCTILNHSNDIYGAFFAAQTAELQTTLNVKTFYEQMWLAEGKTIKYIAATFEPKTIPA